ncbi:MAG TPA: SDR family oxidoreductase [Kofleriaceae bacterium]|jgi:NAD(P)-dependent dehydrogenase (short-subunit alcohol dehydrogenase family)
MRSWVALAAVVGSSVLIRRRLRRKRAIDLEGKIVAITGGSRGLGLVLARTALERGARVAICARDGAELDRARRDLQQHGNGVFAVRCDVTDRDEVIRFIAEVEDELGPIDMLINNAGIIQVGPVELMSHEDFDQALDANVRGPLYAMLAVLPSMRRRGAGRIVNVASIGGRIAIPHLAPYCTSKFALVGLSESMRAELAKDNIFVTTACPGLIRTGSARHAWFKGNKEAEYAWFAIGDSLPVTSVSAEMTAAKILDAGCNGDPEITISFQAQLFSLAHGIAPGLTQELFGLLARFLPDPNGARESSLGRDAETPTISKWTRLADEAARRNNEN